MKTDEPPKDYHAWLREWREDCRKAKMQRDRDFVIQMTVLFGCLLLFLALCDLLALYLSK